MTPGVFIQRFNINLTLKCLWVPKIMTIFAAKMTTRREKNKPKSTTNHQQEQPEVKVKEKNDEVASKMGDFCLDVAKLIIGGVLLAGLMNQDLEYWPLAISGFVAVLIFVVMGIYLIRKSKK